MKKLPYGSQCKSQLKRSVHFLGQVYISNNFRPFRTVGKSENYFSYFTLFLLKSSLDKLPRLPSCITWFFLSLGDQEIKILPEEQVLVLSYALKQRVAIVANPNQIAKPLQPLWVQGIQIVPNYHTLTGFAIGALLLATMATLHLKALQKPKLVPF